MTLLEMVILDVETATIEPENIAGAAHQKCNINYYCYRYIPVVFHNLRGYDGHFTIKQAHEISSEINNPIITAIPNSYEKFMSFDIGNLEIY